MKQSPPDFTTCELLHVYNYLLIKCYKLEAQEMAKNTIGNLRTSLQSTPYSILLHYFLCVALLIKEHILIQLITKRVFVVEWPDHFSSAFMYIDVAQL